jgi:colanic acid/amylovoran biosynthesis protein
MNEKVFIEIRGAGFVNKGAELMLKAILDHFQNAKTPTEIALNLRLGSFRRRNRLGLSHLIWIETSKYLEQGWVVSSILHILVRYIPRSIRKSLRFLLYTEMDVLLDASGFTYSDQFGGGQMDLMARRVHKAKLEGIKVILLPQAAGPFELENSRKKMAAILERADLVFARDEFSFNSLQDLSAYPDRVHLAPDFTNLIPGSPPPNFSGKNKLALIPNSRMIEQTSEDHGIVYLSFIAQCFEYFEAQGWKPFFLLHEHMSDIALVERISERNRRTYEVLLLQDPLQIKGVIGECEAVVSSRYHGIVNALVQGVPVLATGWSHKYQYLMQEYGVADCLLEDLDSRKKNERFFAFLSDDGSREKISAAIRSNIERHKKRTERMWKMVDQIVFHEKR